MIADKWRFECKQRPGTVPEKMTGAPKKKIHRPDQFALRSGVQGFYTIGKVHTIA